MPDPASDLPLAPYRVLDLTGPPGYLAGRMLGDLGADVIKIEPPGGDPSRMTPPYVGDRPDAERSLTWAAYNASKRGITLDLEAATGRALFMDLVAVADFVIDSFGGGCLAGLGLAHADLAKTHPALITVAITPFGSDGPYGDYQATDLVAMAMGGWVAITGEDDRPPVRMGGEQAYAQVSLQAATGAMMAHHHRMATGQGQHVETSMQEAVTNSLLDDQAHWQLSGFVRRRVGTKALYSPLVAQAVWRCRDGYVAYRALVGRGAGRSTRALVEWMGEENSAGELAGVPFEELVTYDIQQGDWDRWEAIIADFLAGRGKEELWMEGQRRGIQIFPVNAPADILRDPQLEAREFWQEFHQPEVGQSVTYLRAPYQATSWPREIRLPAPRVGQHNGEVYGGLLGLNDQAIGRLLRASVI